MHACLGLLLLAGCDQVFGLSLEGHDEDGDGFPDLSDGCPHLAGTSDLDADADGIPMDCDVDDTSPSTGRFFAFENGLTGVDLDPVGATSGSTGVIDLGSLTPRSISALRLQVNATRALVDVGFEVLEDAVVAMPHSEYSELGVFSVQASFEPEDRGDVCFFGRARNDLESVYIELHENTSSPAPSTFEHAFVGASGRMRHVRTPQQLTCSVVLGTEVLTGGLDVSTTKDLAGAIAVTADAARIRISYLWIVYE